MAKTVAYGALLIATAHVLAVLVRYGAALQIGNAIDLEVFMLGYANPRFASALYAVLMPFVASVAIDTNERRLLRAAALAVLSLLWTINIGLDTRAIWFAYLVAVPAALLLVRGRQPLRIAGSLVLSAIIGILVFALFVVGPAGSVASGTVPMLSERLHTLSSRDLLWTLSWTSITQNPLLGLGPMHFATLSNYAGAHPHNWPLQIASEWGLPALGLVLFALVRGVRRVRSSPESGSDLSCSATFAVAIALVYGLVDGNLVMPVSQTAGALALGFTLGSLPAPESLREYRPIQSLISGTAAAAAIAIVISHALGSYSEQSETSSAFQTQYPGAPLTPRFWEQGQIPKGN
jgi:O-antigen ligase